MMRKLLKTQGIERVFKLNDKPVIWSPKQREIAEEILFIAHPRVQVIAPTQYGKSETVSQALLLRIAATGERFTILAPSEKKAQIIMGNAIDHCFDDEMFRDQLELDPGEKLDRMRRQRSREHITFLNHGGLKVLTLDAKNGKRNIEAAMGFGGKRIILDESSLIEDPLYSTVKRMLGGYSYDYYDTFMFEIGNPFYRNHFYKTWHSSRYYKIFIDYKQAIKEGRFSQEFIDEMREEAFFDIFYECLFPPEDAIDSQGYRKLITLEELEAREVKDYTERKVWNEQAERWVYPDGELRLGCDIGGGGDYNVYYLRNNRFAWVESKNQSNDTMTNVSEIQRILKEYPNLKAHNIFIDDVGVGRGVSDRCHELGLDINSIGAGESPNSEEAKTKYKNKKAEAYWLCGQWLKNEGQIVKRPENQQLTWIKYKVTTDKVLMIEPKQDLKKRTNKSPDFAEALMLTFSPPSPEIDIHFA